jgi:hypothetical protein
LVVGNLCEQEASNGFPNTCSINNIAGNREIQPEH